MIATDARDDGFEYGCRNKSRRCQMLLTLLSLRTSFVHTFHFQIFFFKNKKAFENGGKRSALARGQRLRIPNSKVFIFEAKSLRTSLVIENYFYLKQGSDYVTATEFVSAPIFKSIDPSISRNYDFTFMFFSL